MYDHIGLKVKDLGASARFYEGTLAPLGVVRCSSDDSRASFGRSGEPALWLSRGSAGAGAHLAFRAADRAAVDRIHANGDGNNAEAVCLKEDSNGFDS